MSLMYAHMYFSERHPTMNQGSREKYNDRLWYALCRRTGAVRTWVASLFEELIFKVKLKKLEEANLLAINTKVAKSWTQLSDWAELTELIKERF